jgi:uncharacterized coiled-coil protein SlyX
VIFNQLRVKEKVIEKLNKNMINLKMMKKRKKQKLNKLIYKNQMMMKYQISNKSK